MNIRRLHFIPMSIPGDGSGCYCAFLSHAMYWSNSWGNGQNWSFIGGESWVGGNSYYQRDSSHPGKF
jgi:hypothetical protein